MKNEPVQTPEFGDEISFESPILAPNVKAVNEFTAFGTTDDFGVWAKVTDDAWDEDDWSALPTHMNHVQITNQAGTWKAATGSYFWLKQDYLNFVAYAPYTGVAAKASLSEDSGIAITGYDVSTTAANQKDLLVSDRVADKQNGPVAIAFDHVLSSINFVVTNTTKGSTFTVKDISIYNVANTGNYSQGLTAETHEADHTWDDQSGKVTYNAFSGTIELAYTTESAPSVKVAAEENTTALILLPQDFGAESTAKIVVTYSQPNSADATATYNLKNSSWAPGTRYTYTISFGAEEITFTPSANTWTDADPQPNPSQE